MATTLGIKYYNTYVLRKDSNAGAGNVNNWFVEESRIKGDFNKPFAGISPRAYVISESPAQQILGNSIIYSGIFNSRTGINETNQFSVANDITRTVDPSKGTIQKLYAEDTNLIIFQERKVNRALIDKDAIYTAEGQPVTTSTNLVIGQIQPYAGEFGISTNPESFAVYGYRKYFSDANKGSIMRLSQDGLTEISNYGMYDYFRDNLARVINDGGEIKGGWDIHNKVYTVSIQPTVNKSTQSRTLTFDETVLGWPSFFSYIPNYMFSLGSKFYTIYEGDIWEHYSGAVNRANFYGTDNNSSVTTIFNTNPSLVKTFKTVNYEGGSNWTLESLTTNEDQMIGDITVTPIPPAIDVYTAPTSLTDFENDYLKNTFKPKEDKYFANIVNTSAAASGEVVWGNDMTGLKGFFATAKFSAANTATSGTNELFSVSTEFVESSY